MSAGAWILRIQRLRNVAYACLFGLFLSCQSPLWLEHVTVSRPPSETRDQHQIALAALYVQTYINESRMLIEQQVRAGRRLEVKVDFTSTGQFGAASITSTSGDDAADGEAVHIVQQAFSTCPYPIYPAFIGFRCCWYSTGAS